MMENYRVLSAMLALREFTVKDLSLYSDVKSNTVWNTINRERVYLEEMPRTESGKKGGQWHRWRLRPDQIDHLKSRLSELFSHMKINPDVLEEPESAPEVPIGLLVAEDTLLRLYPEAKSPQKKRELLELAEINFDAGRVECENLILGSKHASNVKEIHGRLDTVKELLEKEQTDPAPVPVFVAHMNAVAGLIELSRLEYDLDRNRKPKPEVDVQALHHKLTILSHDLWSYGGGNRTYAFDTMQRLANSPVINRALAW